MNSGDVVFFHFRDHIHISGVAHFQDRVVSNPFPGIGEDFQNLTVDRRSNGGELELGLRDIQVCLRGRKPHRAADTSQSRLRGLQFGFHFAQLEFAAFRDKSLSVEALFLDMIRAARRSIQASRCARRSG